MIETKPKLCVCKQSRFCLLLRRPSCDPPEGRPMSSIRWAECVNLDGRHEAWFAMFLRESEQDRCPEKIPAGSQHELQDGPGTELKKMLNGRFWKMIGIAITSSCRCNQHLRKMNEWGPDKCYENKSTILEWLREEHEEQKISLPFSEILAMKLITKAIKRTLRD